jgi:hypothetical protein
MYSGKMWPINLVRRNIDVLSEFSAAEFWTGGND